MKLNLGRYVFGLGAVAFGVLTLFWHDLNNWYQIPALENILNSEILSYIIGVIEILGGIAILWKRTVRLGAVILCAVFLILSLLWLPLIVENPLSYGGWGNFFLEFCLVSGTLIIYASTAENISKRADMIAQTGYIIFGISVISFALYQLFYLSYTAGLVPKWIPPGQMFWAVTTTIAFVLAAAAILTGRSALLASRLLTLMLILFGVLVFLPGSYVDPHDLSNWSEIVETFSAAGVSWITADYLYRKHSAKLKNPDSE